MVITSAQLTSRYISFFWFGVGQLSRLPQVTLSDKMGLVNRSQICLYHCFGEVGVVCGVYLANRLQIPEIAMLKLDIHCLDQKFTCYNAFKYELI